MNTFETFRATDRMADLIDCNYNLLQLLGRFGISLGFGEKTVDEVCQMYGVDAPTFLAVVSFVHSGYTQTTDDLSSISVPALTNYLRQSHEYFLRFRLPFIGKEMKDALCPSEESKVAQLLCKQFDRYVAEVRKHMQYEDLLLFPYVDSLLKGEPDTSFQLKTFSQDHHPMDHELRELKHLLLRYSPQAARPLGLNDVLHHIYDCAEELDGHAKIEDYLFVPAVYKLEEKVIRQC